MKKQKQERPEPKTLEEAIELNMGLVRQYAWSYARMGRLEFEDLVQEGCIGVVHAWNRFDPGFHVKFCTYAVWWIRAMMTLASEKHHSILRTSAGRKAFWRGNRMRAMLENAGLPAATEDVARAIGVKPEAVRVAEMAQTAPARLDNPDVHLHLTDGTDVEGEAAEAEALFKGTLAFSKVMKKLSPRDQEVLELRFLREEPLTLEEVARKFGISRERTRQVQNKALDRVRAMMGRAA